MRQIIAFDIGTKNFAYCIGIVEQDGTLTVRHLELRDLGCKKGNLQATTEATIEVLDDLMHGQIDPDVPTTVLIESQMTAAMKCIQTVVNTYFKVTARYAGMDISSRYLSPKHKLQVMGRYPTYTPPNATGASSYKQNKIDSVHLAMWLLEQGGEPCRPFLEIVRGLKKKDDVCDAYLMVVFEAKP